MTDEKPINSIDVSKATKTATEYLEGIYGNLMFLSFRLEDVRMNGAQNRYFVICSLRTSVGGQRTFYSVKVDVSSGNILEVQKGYKDEESRQIEWIKENIPED